MKNITVLVTGATNGIGKETALQLARMGAKVLIHGRDRDRGMCVLEEINSETSNENLGFYLADFSSLAAVKQMADDIKQEQTALHVLINNAGNFFKERLLSADGFEMTFAVNHLAPFLLTILLLDLLKGSTPARIVNVASSAHHSIKFVDFENLQSEKEYDPYAAYSLSKLGNVLFNQSLATMLAGSGVTTNALHPGVVSTNLLHRSYAMEGISIPEGAQTSVYLASSPEVEGLSGRYYKNKMERNASALSQDKALQERFWMFSMEMVGDFVN